MNDVLKGVVLTANRLRDGEVVFYTGDGKWSLKIDEAVLVPSEAEAVPFLERAKIDEKANLVTGLYTFDAERQGAKVKASHIRERIRTLGPTVRIDTGKQAEGTAGAFAAEGN